jgi:hypothetical protein
MKKSQFATILITAGAIIDTLYTVISENTGLLEDLGVSPKFTKVVMLLGLIFAAYNRGISPKQLRSSTPFPTSGPTRR